MLAVVVIVQSLQLKKAKVTQAQMQAQPKPIKINEPTAAELEAK
ncbi:MAG: hypothetical protein K0S68_751, partial [Candidatus Saccharibacteria bacterium]|nr:hypothetical protein [Candidatus Saccharibacteria bacterium]